MKNKKTDFFEDIYLSQLKDVGGVKFTPRQIQIISFVLAGKPTKTMAQLLSISPKSVDFHLDQVMKKIGCHSRSQISSFVEKSNRLSLFQEYYLNWIQKEKIEEILSNIKEFGTKDFLNCVISYESVIKFPEGFLDFLVHHLELTGLRVSIIKRKKNKKIINNESPNQKTFTLYLISSPISPLPKIETDDALGVIMGECSVGVPHFICYTKEKNYYSFLIKILKNIFPGYPLKKYFEEHLYENTNNQNSIPMDAQKVASKGTKKFLYPGKTIKASKRIIIGFLGIISLIIAFFSANAIFNHSNSPSIRSDLIIPVDGVLLERPFILDQIKRKLKSNYMQSIPIVALVGVGGVGKTTLARQYGRLYNAGLVWEINAETQDSLINSFKQLANELATTKELREELNVISKSQNIEEKQERILFFVKNRLKFFKKWLLIYDNVENFPEIKHYLPQDPKAWGNGQIIITTRDMNIKNTIFIEPTGIIELDEISKEEAFNLFTKILYGDNFQSETKEEKDKVLDLITHLPSFPLDISVAAYYIKSQNISYEEYFNKFIKNNNVIQNSEGPPLKGLMDYNKTRYDIISSSLKNLIDTNPHFKELLFFIALLDSQNIPKELLTFDKKEDIVNQFMTELKKNGFITENPLVALKNQSYTFSIHRSVQAAILDFLNKNITKEEKKEFLEKITEAVKQFNDLYTSGLNRNCAKITPLLIHSMVMINNLPSCKIDTQKNISDLLLIIGYVHRACTMNFKEAAKFFSLGIEKGRNVLPKKVLAEKLKELGFIYRLLLDAKKSRESCLQSINYAKKIPYSDFLIAENYSTIAMGFNIEQDWDKANFYYDKALEKIDKISKKSRKHRELKSRIYGALSWEYRNHFIHKNNKALEYSFKALESLDENILLHKTKTLPSREVLFESGLFNNGPWHRLRLMRAYIALGNYDPAKEQEAEIEYILKNNLYCLPDDPYLRACLDADLSELYLRTGNLKKAQAKIENALRIFKNIMEEDLPLNLRGISDIEILIRLNKLHDAYTACEDIFKMKNIAKDNYSKSLYAIVLYDAAIIKYKQHDLQKSAEHFSEFFKQMKDFCKGFLELNEYKELESKGVFAPVDLSKPPSKKDIKEYLNRSIKIFSVIYGPNHSFVKDYVMKN